MKDAMSKYFNLRKEYFDTGSDYLFMTQYDQQVNSFIYQGEKNDEEEISWKPIEKNKKE